MVLYINKTFSKKLNINKKINIIMESVFDFFDDIYCINLHHRYDRWVHARNEFEKIGIKDKVKRFSAIKHKDGRIGLICSFLEIFKIAKSKKLNNVLIFEDDVKFLTDDPVKILEKSISQLDGDWGMVYFGANTHQQLIKTKNENLVVLKNAYSAHAVCYHSRLFDDIIYQFTKIKKQGKILSVDDINDVFFAKLQNKYNAYMVNPMIATQYANYSDLEKREVNYDFIEERYNRNIK